VTAKTFQMDGHDVPFEEGQSILAAALAAGSYVPYLCYHAEFKPHGSCKVCTVKVNGRTQASCTTPAREGDVVESNVDELNELRKNLVQFLFTEGNHFCPSCEAERQLHPAGGRLRARHDHRPLQPALSGPAGGRLAPGRPPRLQPLHPVRAVRARERPRRRQETCSRSRGAASPSTWS
jgi:predicted molibdopterin-dependent oxidoreductase YjgC